MMFVSRFCRGLCPLHPHEGALPPSTPRWGLRPQTPNSSRGGLGMAAAHTVVTPPGAAAIPNPCLLIMGVQGTCPGGVQGQSPWWGAGAKPLQKRDTTP